jgi:outer membrane lipoprotein SlyB
VASAQSIKVPDFRHSPPPPEVVPGPRPGEPCERCGVIRSIREVQEARPVNVPGAFQTAPLDRGGPSPNLVGAVAVLPLGEGHVSGQPYVGGVGTPEMRERFTNTSYEITIRLDDGGYNFVTRRDGARFRIGDRVRVEGTQLTLLAP